MSEYNPATKRSKQDKENLPEINPEQEKVDSNLLSKKESPSYQNQDDDKESGSKEESDYIDSDDKESINEASDDEEIDSDDESNIVIEFDIRSNHRYKCDNGGRFQKCYVSDDGSEFCGSSAQAHKKGLSWSQHGRYTCCNTAYANTSYQFKLDSNNQYDNDAVKIIGKQTRELLGHVPRTDNQEVKQWLEKQKKDASIKIIGRRICGNLLGIKCIIKN